MLYDDDPFSISNFLDYFFFPLYNLYFLIIELNREVT